MNETEFPPTPTSEEIDAYLKDHPELWLPGTYPHVNQGPSFFQKATNFSRAITQHLAAGLPQADEATVAHRLEVCHSCEHFDAVHTACRICGCNMAIKVRWAEQHCPASKW